MKFLILPFLDEILSNLFVWMNILAITIQQICSYKTLLVWNIWQNVSQTFHKTPSYGPGSELWPANGRGLYLTPTTEFPTWCVEAVSAGAGSWRTSVVCHRGGIPQGVCQLKKGSFILNRVMLYTKIISHEDSATRDRYVNVPKVIWQQVHWNTKFYSIKYWKSCQEVIFTQLTHIHIHLWRNSSQ